MSIRRNVVSKYTAKCPLGRLFDANNAASEFQRLLGPKILYRVEKVESNMEESSVFSQIRLSVGLRNSYLKVSDPLV